MNNSLEAIAANIVTGDKKAYDVLFKEYYIPLVLFSARYVESKDIAEDIVQDFFCKLWQDRNKLSNIKSFKAYLYSSVKNRSLNYLRDKKINASLDFSLANDEQSSLEAMMEEEIYRELIKTIDLLPPKCKQIFLIECRRT